MKRTLLLVLLSIISIVLIYSQSDHEFIQNTYSSEIDCEYPFTYDGEFFNVENLLKFSEEEIDLEKYRTIIRNGDISSLDKPYLNDLQLGVLTKTELKLFRNLFYAINGYIFSDEELTKYFSQFSWYNPKTKNINFTDLEDTAIKKIKLFEAASSIEYDYGDKDIIWEEFNGGSDQRGFLLKLNKNHTFEYIPNQNINRVVKIIGTWSISFNKIKLSIEKEYVLFGGFIADHPNTPYIDKGTSVTINYERPLEILLPLNKSEWNLDWNAKWIKIGSADCYISD